MAATLKAGGRTAVLLTAAVVVSGWRAEPASAQAPSLPVVRLEGGPAGQGPPQTLPVTRLEDRDRGADLDTGRPVSLTFAEPLPVRDVLLLLFRGTPLSVAFESGVSGVFSGELSGLTLRQAVEAVLFTTNLDYEVHGAVVRVFPRRPSTRLFEVSHLDVRRAWQRRTTANASADATRAAADLTTAAGGDFFGSLEAGVRALLSESGRLHVDRTAGIVQVTDFADRLDQAALYVEAVSLRASRQVRIEARVLEVSLAGAGAVDWKTVAAQAGAAVRADASAGMRVTDFDGLLRAIAGFGPVRTLAAPRILAMNNEPAVMRVGSDGAAFEAGGEGRPAADAAPPSDLTLTIVPQVGADGIVHMSVSPSIVAHPGAVRGPAGSVEADSVMRVRGGDTVVIAGLIREDGAVRRELVVLITPTVVSAGASPAEGAR